MLRSSVDKNALVIDRYVIALLLENYVSEEKSKLHGIVFLIVGRSAKVR